MLGLIFLRYADHRFRQAEQELEGKGSGRRTIGREDYQAKGVMYLPPEARFSDLLSLPEGENIGKAVEAENEDLKGVLPRSYTKIENSILFSLLKNFSKIDVDEEGDKFGKIYEYFLGNFARAEGQRGGEFFTPTSIVKLIVEIIEPYHGRIYDPACGSGGMFVQSGDFIGVAAREKEDFVFAERLEELNEVLEVLNSEARELEERIAANVTKLLEEASDDATRLEGRQHSLAATNRNGKHAIIEVF